MNCFLGVELQDVWDYYLWDLEVPQAATVMINSVFDEPSDDPSIILRLVEEK